MIEQLQLIQQDLDKLERSATSRIYALTGPDRRLAIKRRNYIRNAERAIANAMLVEREITKDIVEP